MRIAQYRARNERFDLKLPPLEDMFAVNAALNQIVEAVAADMLDLKRADFLLKSLRFAAQALKNSDKWPASIAHTDQPAPEVDLAATYGLPNDLDLNLSPELAFPPPVVILSGGGLAAAVEEPALSLSKGPASDLSSRAQADASADGVEGSAFPWAAPNSHPCPPSTTATTAPAVPTTPSASTFPSPPSPSSSARSSKPVARPPS